MANNKTEPVARQADVQAPPTAPPKPAAQPAAQVDVAAQAARDIEMESLLQERDGLRDKLEGADADELVLLRAEVDALRQAAARAGVAGRTRFELSQGIREELERNGFATDPGTGAVLVRDESGKVTETTRSGQTRTLNTRIEDKAE